MTINSYTPSKSSRLLALSWQYDVLTRQLEDKKKEYEQMSDALKDCENKLKDLQEEIDNDKSVQQA